MTKNYVIGAITIKRAFNGASQKDALEAINGVYEIGEQLGHKLGLSASPRFEASSSPGSGQSYAAIIYDHKVTLSYDEASAALAEFKDLLVTQGMSTATLQIEYEGRDENKAKLFSATLQL